MYARKTSFLSFFEEKVKKIAKTFGGIKKTLYLCIAIRK